MKTHHCGWISVILLASVITFTPRLGHAASYAPIDCAKISTTAEATVCKSYTLGQDEARMSTLFGVLTSLVPMGQRGNLVDTQRQWISVREACGSNTECLSRAYQLRINELSQALDALAKQGPF